MDWWLVKIRVGLAITLAAFIVGAWLLNSQNKEMTNSFFIAVGLILLIVGLCGSAYFVALEED